MIQEYFSPSPLAVTPTSVDRVLLVGNCIFDLWRDVIGQANPGAEVDHFLFDHVRRATEKIQEQGAYDLRLIQVPLRVAHPEYWFMQTPLGDAQAHEDMFARACDMLRIHFEMAMQSPIGGPTFFLNYPLPQQPMIGRLTARYDLSEPLYFMEQLNREVARLAASYPNTYLLDIDHLASTFGRRFMQDDGFWVYAHGGMISDYDFHYDRDRLEPEEPLSARFQHDVHSFLKIVWNETATMLRTVRGTDRVKMVCVDLDDTMWRGVLAEADGFDHTVVEGWPVGFAEALAVLKKRGILLAIVSKNDLAQIERIWPNVFGHRLFLQDFAIRKIDWQSKADNVKAAIAEANVLPDSVIFIDDNPVERARVAAAVPGIRTLGAPHMDWRRILLWSAETQVPFVTDESLRRTEMVQAQIERERHRSLNSQEDFLKSLDLHVESIVIDSTKSSHFNRALELLNKTNQFNTTGRRWTVDEAEAFLDCGGLWWAFSVRDRFTNYGVVAAIVFDRNTILQFVMSCRVFGLGIEQSALALLMRANPPRSSRPLCALLVETDKNSPCRAIYRDLEWEFHDGVWVTDKAIDLPPHLREHA